MTYKLFIDDDDRRLMQIYPSASINEYVVAKTFAEACAIVLENGSPYFVSFDNDLGETMEGYDFAKFLVEMDLDNKIHIPSAFDFHVHSANCVAWNNIKCYLDGYLRQRKLT